MSPRASEWMRYTLTALAGAAAVLVTGTLTFGDVRRDAADAKQATDNLAPRVDRLEVEVRVDGVNIERRLVGIESDVKELLRRVPPK